MPNFRFLRRVFHYFADSRLELTGLLFSIGFSTLLGLASVWPMAILVDSVLSTNGLPASWEQWLPEFLRGNRGLLILGLAGSVFALRILQELLGAVRTLLDLRIAHQGLMKVRCALFEKLQMHSLGYHRSQPQGDTIYRLTNDTQGCQQILSVMIEVLVAVFTLVIMLAIMLSRSVELTLIALSIVPLLLMVNVFFGRVLGEQSRQARQLESRLTATVQRAFDSIELIQAFRRERQEYGQFRAHAHHSLGAWYRLSRQFSLYRICVGTIFGLGSAAIFGYGGWLAYHDQILAQNPDGMTVGSLMVFATYLGMFYDPLCKISGAAANVAGAVAAMERVFEVLDLPCQIADSPEARPLPVQPRALEFDSVSFEYEPAKPVLRNLSFEIPPGEMVAFVGSSGVGKSTILKLLCRFLDPTSGSVRLDGKDLRDISLESARQHVAVVLQDSFVLPTSVAENIAYGRPDATREEIREAARAAGAADFIEALPDQYDTLINERGANLSGGQRQRIAIARALLTEAPVIILDEPTSALDMESETGICETLRLLKGQRTIVLVSHRLKAVADCDQIFVMHEGRLMAQGTHQELQTQGGWYAQATRSLAKSAGPAEETATVG